MNVYACHKTKSHLRVIKNFIAKAHGIITHLHIDFSKHIHGSLLCINN